MGEVLTQHPKEVLKSVVEGREGGSALVCICLDQVIKVDLLFCLPKQQVIIFIQK